MEGSVECFRSTWDTETKRPLSSTGDRKNSSGVHGRKTIRQDRLNLGTTSKFSSFAKIWQRDVYDFCIMLCSDLWHQICDDNQRMALLDLHLTRCQVEYVPQTVVEGKKKRIVKDEWGRVQYTDQMKTDDDGNPKWYVAPLDLVVFSENGRRYGMWYEDLASLANALKQHEGAAA